VTATLRPEQQAAGPPVPADPAGPGRRGRRWTVAAMAGAVLAVFAGATALALAATGEEACACSPATEPEAGALGPGTVTVEVPIEHSVFAAEDLTVVAGTEVRFVLANRDPIGHELIVGPPEVHTRHEGGHEAAHPPRPGEVSVEPNSTAETTYTFEEPGEVEYACHLPGHYDYGMHGTITVVPA
jgi:uncharacterized cupredoxin-like copper-binding protein